MRGVRGLAERQAWLVALEVLATVALFSRARARSSPAFFVDALQVASSALHVVAAAPRTVSVSSATAAGRESPWLGAQRPGTINLLLADADPAPEAMVNLAITATEAKTLTLVERGLRTATGWLASGTSTDAVVVACSGEGPRLCYAGPATLVGHLAGECVREAMAASLQPG